MTESKALALTFEMFIPGPQIAYLGSRAKDLGTVRQRRGAGKRWHGKITGHRGGRRPTF